MKRKRFTEEQIAFALRQSESGAAVTEITRKLGVSEQTFYRWKRKYAGLGVAELRRLKQIDRLLDQFPLLPETPVVFGEWLRLVTKHGVIGKQVHDTRLVAILNTHRVARLLTFNTGDFKVFDAIAVSPDEIVAG
ncbi:MAG: transposase [Pirellulales bacterium]|nr:transposase [Pirellulales bacterium]